MKKTRIAAILTAAALILSLLSGCAFDNMLAKPKPGDTSETDKNSGAVSNGADVPDHIVITAEEFAALSGALEQDEEEAGADQEPLPDPDPIPEPEPDPFEERANEIIAGMTGDELIYQMFVITPEQLTGVNLATVSGKTTQESIEKTPVAGIVYAKKNMVYREQVIKMTEGIQKYAKYGLILCLDEEGGRVRRLEEVAETFTSPMFDFKDDGKETAFTNALTIGKYVAELGFNANLAPVADVWSNSENTVIGDRAYSDDYRQAAELVASAVEGFHSAGLITTLKHFPGHGATAEDSHEQTAVLDKSLAELTDEEFLPFSAGIEAGSEMVMVGHILLPQIDSENISTFSEKVLTGLLRETLGFRGVIITDAMDMGGTGETDSGRAAVRAIRAGADLILVPSDFDGAVKGVSDAIITGELSYERLIESVRRVLIMKLHSGVIE